MARTPRQQIIPQQHTALASWEEEMARDARKAAEMERNVGGGGFFSTRGGILSLNDVAQPDNQIACVILDSILENVYYEGAYDANTVTPPVCFAFARDEVGMKPHDVVFEHHQEQHPTCGGCPQNEWGSAERGRGKACANRRRLALLGAGVVKNDSFTLADAAHLETSPIALLKLPVTSVAAYANYVKQLSNAMQRPPYGVISLIKVVPDPKTQFKVIVSLIDKAPDALIPIIMRRRKESETIIEQPYLLDFDTPAQTPTTRMTQAAKAAAAKPPFRGGRPVHEPEVRNRRARYT